MAMIGGHRIDRVGVRGHPVEPAHEVPAPQARYRLLPSRFAAPRMPALTRHRVVDALRPVSPCRFVLMTAPAGSGKTTALASLCGESDHRVAWYQAAHSEAEPEALLAHLEHALRGTVEDLPAGPWWDVGVAASALGSVASCEPTLLIVDDLHELAGTDAERCLEELIYHLPPWLAIVAGSRHAPRLNLSQLLVRGLAVEVPSDVLRWRHWEVEQLFRDFYREPLRPEEAAHLTRRTEGWVAGLQLFHLASQRLSSQQRRALIEDLHTRPGLVREYLTRNVLSQLPDDLRTFLIDTCVLVRVDADLCDALRRRSDSAQYLHQLEQRRLFTVPTVDGRGYRYHEVLRSYLEVSLLARDGPSATRERFARAGELLERSGDLPNALHAFARAEAWEDVNRLLGSGGETLSTATGSMWLDALPEALVASDPWLLLAHARSLRSDGRFEASIAAYERAGSAFGGAPGASICAEERLVLLPWVESGPRPPRGPTDLLRAALDRDPRRVAEQAGAADDGASALVAALAGFVAGDLTGAQQRLRAAEGRISEDGLLSACGQVVDRLIATSRGHPVAVADLYHLAEVLEQAGHGWFGRLVRLLADIQRGASDTEVDALLVLAEVHGDRWGHALLALIAGIAEVVRGRPRPELLDLAATAFRQLGADVPAAWAEVWALAGSDATSDRADAARQVARQAGLPAALDLADLLVAASRDTACGERALRGLEQLGWSADVLRALRNLSRLPDQLRVDGATDGTTGDPGVAPELRRPIDPDRSLVLRCFGAFELEVAGRRVELTGLRPQCQQLLGRLAIEAGTPVPRHRLVEDLWDSDDVEQPTRKLQVLISTLRRHLEPEVEAGRWELLLRRGEAYLLTLPSDGDSDVRAFTAAMSELRRAHHGSDLEATRRAAQQVVDLYRGELLPELGTPSWLELEREGYRSAYEQAAQTLVRLHLHRGDPDAAIGVARAVLPTARFNSRLWEGLRLAYERSGDHAAAARTAREHDEILAELVDGEGPS